jgi:hypothetical protein
MSKVVGEKNGNRHDWNAQARAIRRRGKRIAASKSAALRLLAATGMYTLKGEIKPQFR